MNECTRCGKCFRDKYNLGRHISRTKPCEEKPKVGICASIKQIRPSELNLPSNIAQINTQELNLPSNIAQFTTFSCEFCFQSFHKNSNKTRHLKTCKSKEDPIRQLEIELEIDVVVPENKLECRFCNKVLSRIDTLNRHNCKDREQYHQNLLKQKETGKGVINNFITNNFNNCVTNNVTNNNIQLTVVLNKETITQDDVKSMIKELHNHDKNFIEGSVFFDDLRMVDLVSKFHRIINSHLENKNILLGSTQYPACKFLTEDGTYINRPTEEVIDEAFRVRSGQLFNMKQSIHEQDPEVLRKDRIKRSWGNLKEFKEKGFKAINNNKRRAKTTFKVAMVN